MSVILEGLPGVLCQLDDVLAFGKDCQDHNVHLQAGLEWIRSAGITRMPHHTVLVLYCFDLWTNTGFLLHMLHVR